MPPGVVPATAVVIGALFGVFTGVPAGFLLCLLPVLFGAIFVSWRRGATIVAVALAALGIFAAAAARGAGARDRALGSGLRALLDAEYGGFLLEHLGPEGAHGPIATRFELTEDGAQVGEGVTLRAAVRAVRLGGAWQQISGEGVRITVGGVASRDRLQAWRAGRTFAAPVTFHRPARYLNRGVPDFERDSVLDGITLTGSVKSGLLVRTEQAGSAIEESAARVRAHVRQVVSRWVAPHNAVAGAIVVAVLIGDRTGLPNEVRERLQAAGTYHVIAISGGNIAILAGLVLLALMCVGIQGRAAASVTILVLIAYSQVVTAGPSVWRATVMAILYLAARLLDHRTPPWHALIVAAAGMVSVTPLDVRDPGFVLTFGATGALLAAARWGRTHPMRAPRATSAGRAAWSRLLNRRGARWVMASLMASTAVEIALMPVSAEAFSRVTSAGLALNLLAVPLMAVVQMAGSALVIVGSFETLARLAGWIAYASAMTLVESARLVDLLPALSRRVPAPGLALMAIYYAGLAGVLLPRRRLRAAGGAVLACAWLAIVTGAPTAWSRIVRPSEPGLRLTVFDVGQAEAMLLEARDVRPLAIDAGGVPFGGGGFDVGGRVLAPAFWARGILSLEALLVTHGDPDHLGGAPAVVRDFAPRQLWTGVDVPRHEPSQSLVDVAERTGTSLERLRAGRVRAWGHARIRVLHPPEPDWERQRVRNDDSVVVEVVYGRVALLLTGDISEEIERAILPQLTPAPIRILKVAHHGSRTSTSRDLLEAWRPQIAVISCGRGNRFGHPTREVLARLEAIGARVLRTDRHGAITIETDGESVEVGTFVGDLP